MMSLDQSQARANINISTLSCGGFRARSDVEKHEPLRLSACKDLC
jgi:hypothetical protein